MIRLACLQALQEIVARGADPANIRVIAVVAAPPALKLMADTYPGAQHRWHSRIPAPDGYSQQPLLFAVCLQYATEQQPGI
jgi:hypothetical protein